jgi:hypothetical protein
MFVTKEGKKINTDNPKMLYDVYNDKGWWAGTVEYVSLYEYLDSNPATMKLAKRVYNEARRHGVQVKRYIHPPEHNPEWHAKGNSGSGTCRYPRPWLDMLFDVILFDLGEQISS